jgi:uncharacterized protein
MIDFDAVVGFDWDAGNVDKNTAKHGVTRAEIEEAFADPALLVVNDARRSAQEPRFHALGRSRTERGLHITFTIRKSGTLIRVISARDMSRRERNIYGATHEGT